MRRPVSVVRSRNVSWNPSDRAIIAIVEVAVLVLERQIVVERERTQIREILDLV
jgi:hypothetical protein